jgi:hypothetical protein
MAVLEKGAHMFGGDLFRSIPYRLLEKGVEGLEVGTVGIDRVGRESSLNDEVLEEGLDCGLKFGWRHKKSLLVKTGRLLLQSTLIAYAVELSKFAQGFSLFAALLDARLLVMLTPF